MTNPPITRYMQASIAALALASYACSSTGAGTPSGISNPGSGAAGSGAAGSGAAGSGATVGGGGTGSSSSPILDPTLTSSAGTATMPVDEGEACGTGEASAKLKDVSMFIVYDRSWSMTQCADPALAPDMGQGMGQGATDSLACTDGVSPSRWQLTSRALTLFFQDPAAADLRVALRFFPDDEPGCTGFGMGRGNNATPTPNCDVSICAQPQVDVGRLTADAAPTDAQEQALVAAVAAAAPPGPAMPNPNPATPTSAALGGALQWATTHQAANPDEQTVVVLVTDGEPYGCDTNPDHIAQLAIDAHTQSGVLTYVIGLTGSSEMQLNQLAASGGTNQAFFVADGNAATQQLLDALLAIRGMPVTCDLAVPVATATGSEIDPHLINVNYTSSGGAATELAFVADASACGNEQAWYYDNPAAPTRVILCPAACTTVTRDYHAQIKILAGCKPRVKVPK